MRNGGKGTFLCVFMCKHICVYGFYLLKYTFTVCLLLPQRDARRQKGSCGQAYVEVLADSRKRVMVKFGSWAKKYSRTPLIRINWDS
jgi:hypothetical protein